MPDYRGHYRDQGRTFQRPVLFIQNKFTVQFNKGPINYLPLDVLDRLFKCSIERFDVVYSRPRALRAKAGYTLDANTDCSYTTGRFGAWDYANSDDFMRQGL